MTISSALKLLQTYFAISYKCILCSPYFFSTQLQLSEINKYKMQDVIKVVIDFSDSILNLEVFSKRKMSKQFQLFQLTFGQLNWPSENCYDPFDFSTGSIRKCFQVCTIELQPKELFSSNNGYNIKCPSNQKILRTVSITLIQNKLI